MDNSQKRSRRGLALLVAVAAVFTIGSTSASAATPIKASFQGESYGTFANVAAGQLSSQLGRSAFLPCPCTGTDNELRTETVNSVDAGDTNDPGDEGNVFHADVVFTTVKAGKAADGQTASHRQTAEVNNVSALNGLITADEIKAVARTNATTSVITSNTTGSRFVNLRVNGVLQSNVQANTRINIAGFGFVRLMEVVRSGNGTSSGGISINMLRIVINTNNVLDIPVGAEIIVAHARTRINRVDTSFAVGGGAWSADAISTLPLIVDQIGRIAAVYVPCQGTNGVTLQNNVNLTNFPGVITAGTALSKAFGSVSSTQALAQTSSRIEELNLLSDLVRADVIRANAQATFTGSGGATTGSSQFVNLFIGNTAIVAQPNTVPPNTRVELFEGLVDIGHVILNEQTSSVTSSKATRTVVAVHVVIDLDPLGGLNLPVGTDIRIAVARATAFAL